MNMKIADTFAEALDGTYSRIMISADDDDTLRKAAADIASPPSGPMGKTEAGLEKWVAKDNVPARKAYEKTGFKKTSHILLGFKQKDYCSADALREDLTIPIMLGSSP